MNTVILAAGVGDRLGAAAGGRPKCLLEFGARTLLDRHLDVLARAPVGEVIVVTGFRHEAVDAAIAGAPRDLRIRTVHNPEFRDGSIVSLWCAREHMAGADLLLMDADVLYHPDILRRLFETRHRNCFLLDRDFEPGAEPVKLCIRDGRIVEFRKQIPEDLRFDVQGESVGFFRFSAAAVASLVRHMERLVSAGDTSAPYEDAIRNMVLEAPDDFGYEDVTGIPWIEVDFPEDVERARNGILPRIDKATATN